MHLSQVIVADNYFTGSKDNLRKWIGHPRFELIRHGIIIFESKLFLLYKMQYGCIYYLQLYIAPSMN